MYTVVVLLNDVKHTNPSFYIFYNTNHKLYYPKFCFVFTMDIDFNILKTYIQCLHVK